MKTINDAAKCHAENLNLSLEARHNISTNDFEKSFIEGVKFAQRWIPVERDKDGLVKNSTMDEMESNVPFITRLTNDEEFQYDIWYEFGADIDFDQFYTHWRPIELK